MALISVVRCHRLCIQRVQRITKVAAGRHRNLRNMTSTLGGCDGTGPLSVLVGTELTCSAERCALQAPEGRTCPRRWC